MRNEMDSSTNSAINFKIKRRCFGTEPTNQKYLSMFIQVASLILLSHVNHNHQHIYRKSSSISQVKRIDFRDSSALALQNKKTLPQFCPHVYNFINHTFCQNKIPTLHNSTLQGVSSYPSQGWIASRQGERGLASAQKNRGGKEGSPHWHLSHTLPEEGLNSVVFCAYAR